MTMRTIITYEDPRLRKKSIRVKRIDPPIQALIDDLVETMRGANGVGLAAPQIGILLRVIVCEYTEEREDGSEEVHQTILINPEIQEKAGEWLAEEGCLSIPGFLGTVPRAEKVTVRGQDRAGKRVRLKADGYLAHILQHEIDHLDGTLYVDYLEHGFDDLRPVDPDRPRRRRRGPVGDDEEVDREPPRQEPDDAPTPVSRVRRPFDPCCSEPSRRLQ